MEVLTQLLNSATADGRESFDPKCGKLKLSHLCFADDLLLLFDASIHSLQGIEYVMTAFQSFSGLGVSYDKSGLFSSGISTGMMGHLAATVGVKLGFLPVRYPGVPLFFGKLTIKDCSPIIEKVTARITA